MLERGRKREGGGREEKRRKRRERGREGREREEGKRGEGGGIEGRRWILNVYCYVVVG